MLHPKADSHDLYAFLSVWERKVNVFLHGQRAGCRLEYVDAANLKIKSGDIWFPGGLRRNLDDLTITMGTDMVDGVSEAADTWYYVYARPHKTNPERWEAIFDTTAPDAGGTGRHPTEDWVYLGAVRNNNSSNLVSFDQAGRRFYWRDIVLSGTWGGLPVGPGPCGTLVPPNMLGLFEQEIRLDSTSAVEGMFSLYTTAAGSGTTASALRFWADAGSSERQFEFAVCAADGSGQVGVYARVTAGTYTPGGVAVQLWSVGWVDPFLPAG